MTRVRISTMMLALLALIPAAPVSVALAPIALAETPQTFRESRMELPGMMLIDAAARPRDLKGELTRGRIVIINFAYTTCDSICPVGNDVMAGVDDLLEQEAPARPVRLLTVSIDPMQDTPDLLAEAAARFGASRNWVWLTGDPGDIDRLLSSFGASYFDIATHDPVFLVGDPATGRYLRMLAMPEPEELMAALRHFTE